MYNDMTHIIGINYNHDNDLHLPALVMGTRCIMVKQIETPTFVTVPEAKQK